MYNDVYTYAEWITLWAELYVFRTVEAEGDTGLTQHLFCCRKTNVQSHLSRFPYRNSELYIDPEFTWRHIDQRRLKAQDSLHPSATAIGRDLDGFKKPGSEDEMAAEEWNCQLSASRHFTA